MELLTGALNVCEDTEMCFTCSNHFYHGYNGQYGQDDSAPVYSIAVVVLFSRIPLDAVSYFCLVSHSDSYFHIPLQRA